MAGLLTALPGTQLTRRLEREGRLRGDYNVVKPEDADQCTGGLNFITKRPRLDILIDFHRTVDAIYEPDAYFGRVRRAVRQLDQSMKRVRLPRRYWKRDLRSLLNVLWVQGVRAGYRRNFWWNLAHCLVTNPRAVRYSLALGALYHHFEGFSDYLKARILEQVHAELAGSIRSRGEEVELAAGQDAAEGAAAVSAASASWALAPVRPRIAPDLTATRAPSAEV
jgi:AcrR family transcriptional regulator